MVCFDYVRRVIKLTNPLFFVVRVKALCGSLFRLHKQFVSVIYKYHTSEI